MNIRTAWRVSQAGDQANRTVLRSWRWAANGGIVIVICLRPRKREVPGRHPQRELTSPQGGLAIDGAELTRTDPCNLTRACYDSGPAEA